MTNVLALSDAPDLVVVDVEGNGHSPPDLVEVACLHLTGFPPAAEHIQTWLVRPPNPIIPRVARLHGLTNKLLSSASPWSEVMPAVHSALGRRWLIGHNARIEHNVLRRHIPTWSPEGVIDTLLLSRNIWPELASHSLDALIAHCAIDITAFPGSRHRAAFDAYATAHVFLRLVDSLPERTWGSVMLFGQLNKPPTKTTDHGVQESIW